MTSLEVDEELTPNKKKSNDLTNLFVSESTGSTSLSKLKHKDEKEEEWEFEELGPEEKKSYRGVVARLNFLAQDCLDLQFVVKQGSKEMSSPTRGS